MPNMPERTRETAEAAPAPNSPAEGRADAIRPRHYTELRPEPIDVIECWKLGFHLGNAVKYIARAGRKTVDAIKDLEKASWYLQREIARRKAEEAAVREQIGL